MKRLLFILGLNVLSLGCCVLENPTRVQVIEPLQFCADKERHRMFRQNRELAECAWAQVVESNQGGQYCEDYADGFKDGFADYLNLGGCGVPPPVPPRRYWRTSYQSPAGHAAIQQWYAGFHAGTAMARSSGQRRLEVVPTSLAVAMRSRQPGFANIAAPSAVETMPTPIPEAPSSASEPQEIGHP